MIEDYGSDSACCSRLKDCGAAIGALEARYFLIVRLDHTPSFERVCLRCEPSKQNKCLHNRRLDGSGRSNTQPRDRFLFRQE